MHIEQIQAANAHAGLYFFSPDSMKFFRSTIDYQVLETEKGAYFVTGEKGPHQDKRGYTVRFYDKKTHRIAVWGTFQEYHSLSTARTAAKLAAKS